MEPVPMAQPSPPQRPSLPARPMSVGSDLAASVNLPPVAGSPSLELQGSRPSIEAAMTPVEEESHAAEEGEEVKPKKYLPNAAMSALVSRRESGGPVGIRP